MTTEATRGDADCENYAAATIASSQPSSLPSPAHPTGSASSAPASAASDASGEPPLDPAIAPLLHDAARDADWARVHSLALSHPQSARYTGPDGMMALHHACNLRCPRPDVLEALFRAHPDALLAVDAKHWTPLHYAARFKATRDVVRLLLRDASDGRSPGLGRRAAAMRCSRGRSPLFYAVRFDAPEGVVELLHRAYPEASRESDRDGVTPLSLLTKSANPRSAYLKGIIGCDSPRDPS